MNLRKHLSLLLACVLLLGLLPALANAEGDPVRITFLSLAWIKAEQDATREVVDAWNAEHPEIQVELIQGDWGSVDTELLTGFETGDVPDIFHYWTSPIMTWKTRGFMADLTEMLQDGEMEDVDESVWDLFKTENGSIIALPFQYECDVIFYNKDMFEEHGIVAPTVDNPWTLDDLVENAKILSNPDEDVYGLTFHGNSPINVRYFNDTWATKIGESPVMVDEAGNNVVKLSERYIELAQRMHDMIYVDRIVNEMDGSDAKENLLTGRAAIYLGAGCWMRSGFIDEAEGADINWGMLPPIKIDSFDNYGAIQTLSIPEASEHKKEAMEFLKYFWNVENQIKICKAAYIFPGRISAVNSEELTTSENFWDLAQIGAASLVVPAHVPVPGWGEFMNGIGSTIYQEYAQDTISLEEFVNRVESEGNRSLAEALN